MSLTQFFEVVTAKQATNILNHKSALTIVLYHIIDHNDVFLLLQYLYAVLYHIIESYHVFLLQQFVYSFDSYQCNIVACNLHVILYYTAYIFYLCSLICPIVHKFNRLYTYSLSPMHSTQLAFVVVIDTRCIKHPRHSH